MKGKIKQTEHTEDTILNFVVGLGLIESNYMNHIHSTFKEVCQHTLILTINNVEVRSGKLTTGQSIDHIIINILEFNFIINEFFRNKFIVLQFAAQLIISLEEIISLEL